jgi:thioredoxin 1
MNQFLIKTLKVAYNHKSIGFGKIVSGMLLIIFPVLSCQSQQPKTNNSSNTVKAQPALEHLTSATFKTKIFDYSTKKEWKFIGKKPAIIDFYADWCGPCRALAPTVADVAQQYTGKIDVYKINVDNEQELAAYFKISSIPALLFIPLNGQPQMSVGFISKPDFEKIINDVFKIQ